MTYRAEIITDSLAENGVCLTSLQITYPHIIHKHVLTHRAFSRNSASNRAIPVEKRIREVRDNPFVPKAFSSNKRGMQGGDPLQGEAAEVALRGWLMGAEYAVKTAEIMAKTGVHKQHANRVLEPYLWNTLIVTATDWSNFFAQRCDPDAQPEIDEIACLMRDALGSSTPTPIAQGAWHLPYIDNEDREWAAYKNPERGFGESTDETLRKISVARCARVSYLAQSGKRDHAEDLALYERLVTGMHFSPFEHVATPAPKADHRSGNFRGWLQFRKTIQGESR